MKTVIASMHEPSDFAGLPIMGVPMALPHWAVRRGPGAGALVYVLSQSRHPHQHAPLATVCRLRWHLSPTELPRSLGRPARCGCTPGHAAASLAFEAGASVKEVQTMLRHTRQATTADVYLHVMESVRQGTASKMDDVLRRAMSAP